MRFSTKQNSTMQFWYTSTSINQVNLSTGPTNICDYIDHSRISDNNQSTQKSVDEDHSIHHFHPPGISFWTLNSIKFCFL